MPSGSARYSHLRWTACSAGFGAAAAGAADSGEVRASLRTPGAARPSPGRIARVWRRPSHPVKEPWGWQRLAGRSTPGAATRTSGAPNRALRRRSGPAPVSRSGETTRWRRSGTSGPGKRAAVPRPGGGTRRRRRPESGRRGGRAAAAGRFGRRPGPRGTPTRGGSRGSRSAAPGRGCTRCRARMPRIPRGRWWGAAAGSPTAAPAAMPWPPAGR